jgi:hypothetical protein
MRSARRILRSTHSTVLQLCGATYLRYHAAIRTSSQRAARSRIYGVAGLALGSQPRNRATFCRPAIWDWLTALRVSVIARVTPSVRRVAMSLTTRPIVQPKALARKACFSVSTTAAIPAVLIWESDGVIALPDQSLGSSPVRRTWPIPARIRWFQLVPTRQRTLATSFGLKSARPYPNGPAQRPATHLGRSQAEPAH